jgi:phage baseplate assembly protein W
MASAATVSGERVGIDRNTGKTLTGWAHCAQCLLVLFSTLLNTRLMLLDYGSDIPGMIDRPGTNATFALLYNAMTQAILKWEPGFRATYFAVVEATGDGAFTIEIAGLFYPRGHLGDYSISENATMRFVMALTSSGAIFTGTAI